MKYFEDSTVLHYTWEQVAQGFWKRYPNPYSTHVLSEDTIFQEVKDGKLYTKRLMKKTMRIPKWAERFARSNTAFVVEESIVDPKSHVITTYTRNIPERAANVYEKVIYEKSQDNENWIVANRSAWFDSPIRGFGGAIVIYALAKYRISCQRSVKGFNHVLGKMFPKANDENSFITTKTEKIKDAAKIASNLARTKAPTVFASSQQNDS